MRIISYIAMIATAAFCQLSSCMNKADNPVNGNLMPHVTWEVMVPNDFSASFKSVDSFKIDFGARTVDIPCMAAACVTHSCFVSFFTELIYIKYRSSPCSEAPVKTRNRVGAIGSSIKNARGQSVLNSPFNVVPDGTNGLVKVNPKTKIVSLPSGENIRAYVYGPEWDSLVTIVYTYPNPRDCVSTITPRTFHMNPVGMRQTIERKEEKAQQKMDSERENDFEDSETLSEDFNTPQKKTEESKPPKQPQALKTIEDSCSHGTKDKKKEAKEIEKLDCEDFLDKYSDQPLDEEAKKSISGLFNEGTKITQIVVTLSNFSDAVEIWKKFELVRKKITPFVKELKSEKKAAKDSKTLKKKEAKEIEKLDREDFVTKYSIQDLDEEAEEKIRAVFNRRIKSATKILCELSNSPNDVEIWKKFESVRQKVYHYIKKLESEKEAAKDSKTPKKKTEESKPPKQPKSLETIEDSCSHGTKDKKKEAKKIE